MFTLSLFNQKERNDVHFWRPMACIPNLGYGAPTKEDTKLLHTKTPATYRLQNEHNCIVAALAPLVDISRCGGIRVTVQSKPVIAKVWIPKVCTVPLVRVTHQKDSRICKLEPLFSEMRSQSQVTLLLTPRLLPEDTVTILLDSSSHSGIINLLGVDIHRRPNDNHKSAPPKSPQSPSKSYAPKRQPHL
jgi:hypothetical protein